MLLFRHLDLFVAIAAAALVLGLVGAAGPLFVASAGSASLERQLQDISPFEAGLRVTQYDNAPDDTFRDTFVRRDATVSPILEQVEGVAEPVVTLLGAPRPVVGSQGATQVRLTSRTGAEQEVQILEGTAGVLVDSRSAASLRVGVGDTLRISAETRTTSEVPGAEIEITGIYRTLPDSAPTPFWEPLSEPFFPDAGADGIPPQPVLVSQETFFGLDELLNDPRPVTRWELPLASSMMSIPEAERVAASIARAQREIEASSRVTPGSAAGPVLSFPETASALPSVMRDSLVAVRGLERPVNLVSWAGRAVALIMLAAAGTYVARRRRVEATLLTARGFEPIFLGVKASLESLAPVIAGAVLGWGAAWLLVSRLGPSGLIDSDSIGQAIVPAALVALGGVVVLGIAYALAGVREATVSYSGVPRAVARIPWEGLALLLAAVAFFSFSTETGSGASPMLLVFPLFFVAGAAGAISRAIGLLLPRLSTAGRSTPTAVYLAARRLGAAPKMALLLITAAALAVGVLTYAGTLAVSTRATGEAKARISVGSDVAGEMPAGAELPGLGLDATLVTRIGLVQLSGSDQPVTILAIDPETFADVAFWLDDFASRSLEDIVGELQADSGALRVLATGAVPAGTSLSLYRTEVPLDVVERASAIPGMHPDQPTIVATKAGLASAFEAAGGSLGGTNQTHMLWIAGDQERIVRTLAEEAVPISLVRTAGSVENTPALLAAGWSLQFLQALGAITALVVLAGMILYLQSRHRASIVSFALAGRMGLAPASFRRSIVIELGAMLLVAAVIGIALALVGVLLVLQRFDVLPGVPPEMLLRIPWRTFALTIAVLVVAALLGGRRMQRTAQRAHVSEVLRLAG